VLEDPQVQAILASADYDYVIDVGVKGDASKLLPDPTRNPIIDYSGIREYVGILHFGYNDQYSFSIEVQARKLTGFKKMARSGSAPPLPEITRAEKVRAGEFVLNEPTVQALLVGKDVTIPSTDGVVIWTTDDRQSHGLVVTLELDQSYTFDNDIPVVDMSGSYPFQQRIQRFSGQADRLYIFIDLEKGELLQILPVNMSPPPPPIAPPGLAPPPPQPAP
jgi:hypothetical protein